MGSERVGGGRVGGERRKERGIEEKVRNFVREVNK